MPKNDDKLYLNPAIPRDTRLAEYLEEGSARSGITKSQLLVWFAAEYVRIVVDGGSTTATPAPLVAVVSTKLADRKQEEAALGGIRTLTSLTTGDNANYDNMFGEPD